MRKALVVCFALLFSGAAMAQEMPVNYISDYFGVGGPYKVESILVDYRAPWSMPDATISYVFFGEVTFDVYGATVVDHTFASLFCAGGFCVAYNPRTVFEETFYPWNPAYHTYLSEQVNGSVTQYDVLAVDLSGAMPVAHRFYGGYVDHWVLLDSGVYTEYFMQPEMTPVVTVFGPFGQALED